MAAAASETSSSATIATDEAFAPDPWAQLIDAGVKWIERLVATCAGSQIGDPAASAPWIETDAGTGKSYLKLSLPDAATATRMAEAVPALLAALRR